MTVLMPTSNTPSSNFGCHVFGVAALAFGLVTLVWHAYNGWHQPRYLVNAAAAALVIGMVTGNAESDRPHSFGHLYRFLYPRTGVLSWSYCHSCSEVASAKSDVLGGNDDCFVRTRGCGSSYESHGTSRDSPADNDARDLWATRVGTVASFGSPQSYELERKRRDLRDCRSSMDSR